LGSAKFLINIAELQADRFEGGEKLGSKILGKLASKLCLGLGRNIFWIWHLDLVS
jgi:hypothetical protein